MGVMLLHGFVEGGFQMHLYRGMVEDLIHHAGVTVFGKLLESILGEISVLAIITRRNAIDNVTIQLFDRQTPHLLRVGPIEHISQFFRRHITQGFAVWRKWHQSAVGQHCNDLVLIIDPFAESTQPINHGPVRCVEYVRTIFMYADSKVRNVIIAIASNVVATIYDGHLIAMIRQFAGNNAAGNASADDQNSLSTMCS